MFKRPHYIALGLIVVLALVLLNLPARTTAQLKLAIGSIFLPLLGLSNSSQELASGAGDALVPRRALLKQLEALQQENLELRRRIGHTDEVERENARLRQAVGWRPPQPWKVKLARIVLRDPANWWRMVQIDAGSRDGLSVNDAVFTADGALVGRVSSVNPSRSQVVLLGDPNCKVAVRVNETGDTGVITGSGPLENNQVEMGYLSRTAKLKPGQQVSTLGDGGVFPPNILVGQVIDSYRVANGLAEAAHVKLAANLGALEEVWVKIE